MSNRIRGTPAAGSFHRQKRYIPLNEPNTTNPTEPNLNETKEKLVLYSQILMTFSVFLYLFPRYLNTLSINIISNHGITNSICAFHQGNVMGIVSGTRSLAMLPLQYCHNLFLRKQVDILNSLRYYVKALQR